MKYDYVLDLKPFDGKGVMILDICQVIANHKHVDMVVWEHKDEPSVFHVKEFPYDAPDHLRERFFEKSLAPSSMYGSKFNVYPTKLL
ncbi:hypothetical protein [uncultured Cohaesibacter sp.]|uniref:hypothetical protein n=1 Tax=uncultured Cohaesibacter sp. TaxID=1002546 RepID=UPI0029C5FF57|nr:hypothetical protein [uncultured Cohaesibacter sp.]